MLQWLSAARGSVSVGRVAECCQVTARGSVNVGYIPQLEWLRAVHPLVLLCKRALLMKIGSGGYTGNHIQLKRESLNRGRRGSELRKETLVNRQSSEFGHVDFVTVYTTFCNLLHHHSYVSNHNMNRIRSQLAILC